MIQYYAFFNSNPKHHLIYKGWLINTSAPQFEPPPGGVSKCEYVG